MRSYLAFVLTVVVGVLLGRMLEVASSTAEAGIARGDDEAVCAGENGDVNADGDIDISDAITILGHLFLGTPTDLAPLCTNPGRPSGLPDTGQTSCFDENGAIVDCDGETCAGQDGMYVTGCPSQGRFTDNGDGTVTDNCTGLMWQRNTGNAGNPLPWCEALAFCEQLELAGYDDWRLPNIGELLSIVDYGRFLPAVKPVFDIGAAGTSGYEYWSSTTGGASVAVLDGAWGVDFLGGPSYLGIKGDPELVLAVRTCSSAR